MKRHIEMIRKEVERKYMGVVADLGNLQILWEDPIKDEKDLQQRMKISAYYALWHATGYQPPTDIIQNNGKNTNSKRIRYYNSQSRRFNELREREEKQKELRKIRKWIEKQKNPKSPYRLLMVRLYNLAINSNMKASEIDQKAKVIKNREKMEAHRDKFLRLSLIEQAKLWEQIERGGRWQWITERPVKD